MARHGSPARPRAESASLGSASAILARLITRISQASGQSPSGNHTRCALRDRIGMRYDRNARRPKEPQQSTIRRHIGHEFFWLSTIRPIRVLTGQTSSRRAGKNSSWPTGSTPIRHSRASLKNTPENHQKYSHRSTSNHESGAKHTLTTKKKVPTTIIPRHIIAQPPPQSNQR